MTRPTRKARPVVFVLMLFSVCAWAQVQDEAPRWHVSGSAGFDLNGSSQTVLPRETSSSQLFPLGDLRMTADGFLLDPKFLHLNGGFNFQRGVNDSDRGSMDSDGLGLSFSTAFLPRSHIPLRVTYTRNTFGLNGLGVNQDNADSRLDVEWTAMFPNLPRLTLGMQRLSNEVRVPQSFSDRSFRDTGFNVGLSDVWRGWQWAGNVVLENGETSGPAGIAQSSSSVSNSAHGGSFNLSRGFWENRARLINENRLVSRHDSLGVNGSSDSKELTSNTNLTVQLGSRWLAQAGYAYSQVDFNSANFSPAISGAGQTQVIGLTSSTSHSVSGRLEYRPMEWLRLSEEVRNSHLTPAAGVLESRVNQTESISGIAVERRWQGFDLLASYSGRYQLASTTLDRSPQSWSNGFNARVGWGSVQLVRLTGSYENSRLNLVEQIGGFTDQKRSRLEAESYRFKVIRLRGSVEQYRIGILNISGQTETKGTNYAATAEHRLFSVTYSRSLGEGAGALFPDNLINRQFLIVPLPIAQLVGTPLLDRTVQARSLVVMAHPRRRLDAVFSWRKEKNLLIASDQFFDTLTFDARYRMGKVSFEGGYTRNLSDVISPLTVTGDRLTRWYVRVARDFTIF